MNKNLNNENGEYLYTIENYEFITNSETLEYSGKLPKEGFIKVNESGEVTLVLTDGTSYVSKTSDSDTVKSGLLTKEISEIWECLNIEYVMATDSDFSGNTDGGFKYIGTSEYVEIPHIIKNVPITSYANIFELTGPGVISNVKGVKSTNKNVTDMSYMFSYNYLIKELNLSSFDTSNVTNMKNMFLYSGIKTVDLSSFETTNVTNMSGMFLSVNTTTLDLSSFDTSNVTDMSYMFAASTATTLDLSNFNTSNVLNMNQMFANNYATTLNLGSFDTSKVTNMNSMFLNSQAPTLDLSSFDTSKVADTSRMFYSSLSTTGYAKTQSDANKFNSSSDKPAGLTFIVK